MNSKIITAIGLLASAALFSACGGSNAPANSTNTNAANDTAVANSNNPLAATTPTPEQTTNDAPTLTPVVRAYYDAGARLKRAIGRPVTVVATGGLATLFDRHTEAFDAIEADLTIQGLSLLYRQVATA